MPAVEEFFGCGSTACRKLRKCQWANDDLEVAQNLVQHFEQIQTTASNSQTNIPKVIHFIWLGAKPLPKYYGLCELKKEKHCQWNETIASWHEQHSDWEIKLWDDEATSQLFDHVEHPDLGNIFCEAIQAQSYGMASDLARLQILFLYGGIYVDVDYYCVKSVQSFHERFEFFCGASNSGCIEINNGLMGSIPGHPFVQRLISDICQWYEEASSHRIENDVQGENGQAPMNMIASFLDQDTVKTLRGLTSPPSRYSPMEIITHTGPGLLTRAILDLCRNCEMNGNCHGGNDLPPKFAILPYHVFNSLPNIHKRIGTQSADGELVKNLLDKYIDSEESMAVHLWSCSWQ